MALEKARQAIKTACEKKGWSVMELARRANVSPEAIRRFVTGRGQVSTRVVHQLLKALEVDPKKIG